MIRLAVIGAGQIGRRHLEALAKIDFPAQIQVVDPSPASLETAKRQCLHVLERNRHITKVEYFTNMAALDADLDVVIVATLSNIRKRVVETLIEQKNVRYLLLEKVVFQHPEHFGQISRLLKEHHIKAWVNCPLRMYAFYHELKSKLKGSKQIVYHVSSSDLGIGCNAIHHLDIVSFLTDDCDWQIDTSMLDKQVLSSKRPGFMEFTGTFIGKLPSGSTMTVTSYPRAGVPKTTHIDSDNVKCTVQVDKAWLSESPHWSWSDIPFSRLLQSELTHVAVRQIVMTGSCQLTTFDESRKLHIPLLRALNGHLQKVNAWEGEACPIT